MKKYLPIIIIFVALLIAILAITIYSKADNEVIFGDMNKNGILETDDAHQMLELYTKAQTTVSGYTYTEDELKRGDLDGDGSVTALDASYMLTYLVKSATDESGNLTLEQFLKDTYNI